MVERLCKNCFNTFSQFSSLQNLCGRCQYNKMLVLRADSKKKAKPIHRIGKKARAWIEARKAWIKLNPPDEYGYWYCYLKISAMCLVKMDIDQLTLDHILTRSNRPDLIFELTNLGPACYHCNGLRGSVALQKLVKSYPHLEEYIKEST